MRAGTGETELAPKLRTTDHRLGSRLEVERRQTRSSNLGFRARARFKRAKRTERAKGLFCGWMWLAEGFRSKEFRFADI